MQRPYGSQSSYGERLRGALTLDARTYREVEQDVDANGQAALTVVIAALASGIGAMTGQDWFRIALGTMVLSIVQWIVFSFVAYFVGTALFATPQTSATPGQVLRTIGFAQAPKFFAILGVIPILGWLAGLVVFIWYIVASITALQEAFEFNAARAIGTGFVALIASTFVYVILAVFFGLGSALFGAIGSALHF